LWWWSIVLFKNKVCYEILLMYTDCTFKSRKTVSVKIKSLLPKVIYLYIPSHIIWFRNAMTCHYLMRFENKFILGKRSSFREKYSETIFMIRLAVKVIIHGPIWWNIFSRSILNKSVWIQFISLAPNLQLVFGLEHFKTDSRNWPIHRIHRFLVFLRLFRFILSVLYFG
jgi:hypothetical protein